MLYYFNQIKAALGGQLKLVVSGAAPLSLETEQFLSKSRACSP